MEKCETKEKPVYLALFYSTLLYLVPFLFFAGFPVNAQISYTHRDSVLFAQISGNLKTGNHGITDIARFFLDTPYVGGTLESDTGEQLRINLRELDCVTFVENVFALYLIYQNKKLTFRDFCMMLQYIRYRDGIRDGYLSRLHYTSEWLANNRQKGILFLPEMTSGKDFSPDVSFMSSHCDLYPVLKANQDLCAGMKELESGINKLKLCYIPKEEVKNAEKDIYDGDIIAITTHINGLDIAHMGFAIAKGKTFHLLHASSEAKKVIISDETLFDYLKNRKNHSGIIVARIVDESDNP